MMRGIQRSILFLLLVLVSGGAWATMLCRYTVRDIGFIDLQGPTWTLRIAEGTSTQEGLVDAAAMLLQDSNVRLDVVPGSDQVADAWLEDEAGHVLVVPDMEGATGFQRLQAVLDSPILGRIAEGALDHFAVILLLEGTDTASNARAHEAITAGEQLLLEMDADGTSLPRPIGSRPLVMVIPLDAEEPVLRWSLGLPLEAMKQPAIAILYGRSKLAGGVLRGPGLTGDDIVDQLSIVGLSCECDQARDWASLPALPGRWTPRLHEAAIEQLGFDPEHPLVKAEVRRILQRGQGAAEAVEPGAGADDDLLLGYSETVDIEPIESSSTEPVPAPVVDEPVEEHAAPLSWSWIVLGLVICSGLLGAVIIIAGGRRA